MNRLKEDFGNTWKWLAEGWRNISSKAANALTYFAPAHDSAASQQPGDLRWGLLAADVTEHGDHVLIELEAPGLEKDDFDITVEANRLIVCGTKRLEAERTEGSLRITERAFGSFQRIVPLPEEVTAEGAEANYDRGVLKLKVPKVSPPGARKIAVVAG